MNHNIFRTALISLVIITSLAFGGIVQASGEETLPNPGMTPDSPFYIFDKMGKSLGMLLAFSPEAKANKALQYAGERLAEAQGMAAENKTKKITGATDDFNKFMAEAIRNGVSENICGKIAITTSKHLEVLDGIKDKVPEKAKAAIARAKETSENGQIKALQALGKTRPDTAIDISSGVIEKLLERARVRAAEMENSDNNTSGNVTEDEDNEDEDANTSDNKTYDVQEKLDYAIRISNLEDEMLKIAEEKGLDITALQEKLAHSTSNRLETLSGVYEKVPAQAKQGIANAIENSVAKYERAVEKLKETSVSNNTTIKAIPAAKVPEKIREKMELKVKNEAKATNSVSVNVTTPIKVQTRTEEKEREQTSENNSKTPNTATTNKGK
jgi:hypothetical protein